MVLPVIGGIVGRWASAGDKKRQKELEDRAMRGYDDLRAPEIAPIEQRTLDRSMYTGMPVDAGNEALVDEALASMAETSRTGGLGAQGNLAMEQARLQTAARANSANAAIQQGAARRGMGGAGSVVAQQVAQQGANQSASLAGMQAAADAETRRLGATQAVGGMAGATAGRRNAATMERARQLDAINRFEAGLGFQTDVANRGYTQQDHQNKLGLADRKYGAQLTRAGQYARDVGDTRGMWAGIGQGLQDTAVSAGQMMMGNPTGMMGAGGAKSGAAFSPQPQAQGAYPGPVRPQYDQLLSPNWWDYVG
jgi:hypothetical protein